MPELPEVETIRRALLPALVGRRIAVAAVYDPRLVRPLHPSLAAGLLEGHRIERLGRRGKYLTWHLDDDTVAVLHLRMTGALLLDERPDPHTRARLELDDGTIVRYRDVRRFGTLEVGSVHEVLGPIDRRLGPEPLDAGAFTADGLWRSLRRRSAPIKAVLLDQRVVAGVGNIYADEALFTAGIRPGRIARSLGRAESDRLHRAVRSVLAEGIVRGGSTLRDYSRPDGSEGGMQDAFRAYGRAGLGCLACGSPMASGTIAGRTTVWCPACQRRGASPGAPGAGRRHLQD